jgi:hypothetical protein
MKGRKADRRSRSYWTAFADRMCRRLAVAVAALLALAVAAQAALHDDGLRPVLSRTERLEGVPYGDG